MDMWLIALIGIGVTWLFFGTVIGLAGGFDIVKATELGLVYQRLVGCLACSSGD
jgi:hypothetical protein